MTEIITNPLYHYKASEETGADAWSTLASAVAHHSIWEDVKLQFKEWEHEYKVTTSLPIPGAWRSAKSVIKNAFKHAVPLMFGSEVRGKTAIEKEIKAKKEADKEELSPAEQAGRLADKLFNHCAQHGIQLDIKLPTGEWHA